MVTTNSNAGYCTQTGFSFVTIVRLLIREAVYNLFAMTDLTAGRLFFSFIAMVFFAGTITGQDRPYIALREGMLLDAGAYIRPGEYVFSGERPVIIEGDDIDLQFDGVTIRGAADPESPDRFTGVAIVVRNARNVRIGNLKAHGFHTALVLENCVNVYLYNCDFSYNYRPHLQGSDDISADADRLVDLSDPDIKWRDLGAGVYGRRVSQSRLEGNRITGGQHGILLTDSDSNLISGNMIIYNSGVGLGLHDSRANTIRQNHLDFNIRGRRTADAPGAWGAGLLLTGRSCDNTVDFNSLTHGYDGIVGLYRPETTDAAGCTGNRFYRNDCAHNIRSGLTLSQASGDDLSGNILEDSPAGAIMYASTRISLRANVFTGTDTAIVIRGGKGIHIYDNAFAGTGKLIDRDKASGKPVFRNNRSSGPPDRSAGRCTRRKNTWRQPAAEITGPGDTAAPEGYIPDRKMFPHTGRTSIHFTAWGPYDYRFPAAFCIGGTATADRIVLLGPVGADWHTDPAFPLTGVHSRQSGQLPDTVLWAPDTAFSMQQATFSFTGAHYPDIFGRSVAAARQATVTYVYQAPSPLWHIKVYTPRDTLDYRTRSLAAEQASHKPQTPYIREATTTLALQPGEYQILLRYSEAIRLELGGTVVYKDEGPTIGVRTISRPVSIRENGNTPLLIRQSVSAGQSALDFHLIPGRTKY